MALLQTNRCRQLGGGGFLAQALECTVRRCNTATTFRPDEACRARKLSDDYLADLLDGVERRLMEFFLNFAAQPPSA